MAGRELRLKAGNRAAIWKTSGTNYDEITISADPQVVNTLAGGETEQAPSVAASFAALGTKVDKVVGKQLSTEDFTSAEKTKLAGLESSHFKGQFTSLPALQAVTGALGDYAYVDGGAGQDVTTYSWDATDNKWVEQKGVTAAETAASVKSKYESNADTNVFSDAEKAKLAGVAAGAEANQNAFVKVKAGSVVIPAISKTDQFEVIASSGVSITADAAAKTLTISVNADAVANSIGAFTSVSVN